jgi:hypothetical protein
MKEFFTLFKDAYVERLGTFCGDLLVNALMSLLCAALGALALMALGPLVIGWHLGYWTAWNVTFCSYWFLFFVTPKRS